MKIDYCFFSNKTQEDLVRFFFESISVSIPSWVKSLQISNYSMGADDSITAQCFPNRKYLQAEIKIYNSFFAQEPYEQLITCYHEILHLHRDPVDSLVMNGMLAFIANQNPELSELYMAMYKQEMEMFIEGFAIFVAERHSLED